MALHLRILLLLIPVTGIHGLSTISKVSVRARTSISIPCFYGSQYRNHVKYLCKGYDWPFCSYAVKTNQPSSQKFSVSDDKNQGIFTVTIKDLTYKDTHYWCAVEINGGSDVRAYFHLSVVRDTPSLYVESQQTEAFTGDSLTINCYHRNSGEIKWCKLGRICVTGSSGSIDGTRVTINPESSSVFTVTMSELKTESSGWYICVKGDLQMPVYVTVKEKPTTTPVATTTYLTTVWPTHPLTTGFADRENNTIQDEQHSDSFALKKLLIILLCLLLFIVMMTLFIWFILKKHKQTKSVSSTETVVEEEVTYSQIDRKKKTSNQTPYTESDVDMMYSSVVTVRPKRTPKVDADDENVTYSTLAYTSTV